MSDPKLGDVWRYPYLWRREADAGEDAGRKDRPCALALVHQTEEGRRLVYLLPITTQPSGDHPFALEVPQIEKRRAGLDDRLRIWVIADEFNIDEPDRSWHFEPSGRMGAFGAPFVKRVQALVIEAIRARKSRQVSRR